MKYRLAKLILCFGLIVSTPVFAQVKTPALITDQSKTSTSTPQVDPPPVLAVPQGYHYDSNGRRDPFVNPIPKPPPGPPPDAPLPRPPGLKGATVSEVSLMGVLVAKDPVMSRAIFQVPGMKAPVLASLGEKLFDAVIKEVRTDSVVFTIVPPGNKPIDPTESREVTKKLRSPAGDKK